MTTRWIGWLARIGLPFLVLNALLSFENRWPTLWPSLAPRLSFELCMALLGLTGWVMWRGPPGVRTLRALALASTFWIVARYLDVTVSAVFGRQVNLYWDSRHLLDVLHMGQASAWLIGASVIVVVAVPILLYQLAFRCWQAMARELTWRPPRPAIGLVGTLLLVSFAAHGTDGRNTRWFFSMPVAPIIAGQLALLSDQLMPGRAAAQLSPSPAFDTSLAGLRGADVLLVFAESYGVSSIDDPLQAAALAPHRARFENALRDDGRRVVSARVRSPTYGGASWLAHAALLSGVDTRDPGDYELLLTTDRNTLVGDFKANGYRTVAWMPGLQRPWPEGRFYGFDRYADVDGIGYLGPRFGHWRVPDQASMALLHAQELAEPADKRAPRFIVFPTLTSHAPFRPVAPYVTDWSRLLRSDAYAPAQVARALAEPVSWTEPVPAYLESLAYTFEWLGGYLSGMAPRNLLTIVIGDHQPLASVSGQGASWDVPVHVISSDARLLKRFEAHGFTPGMQPGQPSTAGMHALTPLLLDIFAPMTMGFAGAAE